MSKNILQRTANQNSVESYVYTFNQYPESSFLSQRLSSVRLSSAPNIFTNPFGKTTGQWRALNLKVDPVNGYGSEENGAALTFAFSKESNSNPVSIACGFTLGLPPLHSRHVSTVTRSICYGFILNPFPVNLGVEQLYIVHENVLTELSNVPYGNLRIEIKGNTVTYMASGQVLASLTMSNISMVLHVVGCLGFDGNQITNLSLSGGSSTTFTAPNFQKELYIPCLGLTPFSQNTISLQDPIGQQKIAQNSEVDSNSFGYTTNIRVRGTSGKSFIVHYPDGTTKIFNPTTTEPFLSVEQGSINTFSPFTIKITFDSLSDLKGLIVANPLISSELSLDQSLGHLTNLEQIEVRSSFSDTFNPFYPTIGENLPFPTIANSKLKLANIEGSYELKEHDLSRQQQLTNLFISTPLNTSTFPKIASARNLTYFEVESSLDNWFLSNFRNVFTKPRTVSSHGIRRNSQGNSVSLSSTNTEQLAIAQQSYLLMYGLSVVDRDNTQFFNPTTGSGFSITSQWTRKSITVAGQTILIRDYIFEGISIDPTNSLQKIVFYVHSTVSAPLPNQLFCIRTSSNFNEDTLNHQLRRIGNVDIEPVIKVISGVNIEYTKYTVVTKRTKEHNDISQVIISNNNSNQLNTLALTKSGDDGTVFSEVEVGDTVWDRTTSTVYQAQGSQYKPAVVIRKEDGGKRIIVLQGSNGSSGTSISTGSRNIRFGWEWSLLTDPVINTNAYPTDILANDTATFTTIKTTTTTDVFTNTRAAREYLVSVS